MTTDSSHAHKSRPTWDTEEKSVFDRGIFFSARQALQRHAGGGNILIIATVLALVVANIPVINGEYFSFWDQEVRLQLGNFNVFSHAGEPMTLLAFINDALMAIFFFSIGLEIKREVLVGELSSFKQALLPIVGAFGGMIVPVVIFYFLSKGTDYAGGAAIPMATDIAFSLGVLAMLGKRVPLSLKIFLTTLAVVDDIGGILLNSYRANATCLCSRAFRSAPAWICHANQEQDILSRYRWCDMVSLPQLGYTPDHCRCTCGILRACHSGIRADEIHKDYP